MGNKKHILSTVILDLRVINKAALAGMQLDAVPFIDVKDMTREMVLHEHIRQLLKKRITAVFTSANAVHAVCGYEQFVMPDWEIYCTENATKDAVLEYFDDVYIKGTAADASGLAEVIRQDGLSSCVFFCGNKRLDTLIDILQAHGTMVIELPVYKTTETPKVIEQQYDGILFFSPSGVNSFFSVNTIKPETVLFAIGNTTAKAIRTRVSNPVIIGETHSKEQLAEQAIKYFQKEAAAL